MEDSCVCICREKQKKNKRWNKAQMSEEGCIGSPFQFLVARVVAGGWLRCEDEASVRHFSLSPRYLDLQKVSLQELEMYAESWLPRQTLHTGRQRAAQCAWQLSGGWPSPLCLRTPSPVLARALVSPYWKRRSKPATMEVSGGKGKCNQGSRGNFSPSASEVNTHVPL